MTAQSQTLAERLWLRVDKRGPDECWIFQGPREPFGHGRFRFNGKRIVAHRVAYQLTYGNIPDGLCVCHRCDNPPCCNPSHLFLGTKADNARDRTSKGRGPKGIKNGRTKLSPQSVLEIRHLGATGVPYSLIAKRYGINRSHVWRIVKEKEWTSLQAP